MENVGAFDAKTHFSELLSRVQQGESISITRRGVPVAMLVPVDIHQATEKNGILKAFYKWRKGIRWDNGMNTKKALSEGRR
jgi:prevent-host-death family protein